MAGPPGTRLAMLALDSDALVGSDRPIAPGVRERTAGAKSRGAVRPDRHCLRLVGHGYAGPPEQARLAFLRSCLRCQLPAAAARGGAGLRLRREDPRPGDLVLFHNTEDRNGNRRLDDRFTETGVVIRRTGARVEFVYLRAGKARLGVLDLSHPHLRRLNGSTRVLNTFLRIANPADAPETPYLAGELVAGFASPPFAARARLDRQGAL